MKTLLTFSLIMLSLLGNTQEDRFTISIYTEPQLYLSDGFSIGGAIEYQAEFGMYFKAQTYYFPNLNGITYIDVEGVVGFDYRSNVHDWRVYAGAKLGAICRQGCGHPKAGLETGIERYLGKLFIGVQASLNYRTDGRVWESEADNYTTIDVGVKFGIIIN